MEVFIKSLSIISIIAAYALMYVLPFVYVLRRGRFYRGVWYAWGLQIIGMTVLAIPIPGLLIALLPAYKNLICNIFPEGPVVAGSMIMGWLPALIVCGIAHFFYNRKKRIEAETN